MSSLRTLCLCLFFLASGCATNLRVVYTSDPPGAALYEGDKYFGTTPMTLTYPVTPEDKKLGSKRLRGTAVRWISGATARLGEMTVFLSNGLTQVFTYQRPDGVPGHDVDANYALQGKAGRQVEAARQRASQLQRQQMNQELTPRGPSCTSRMVGSTIYTDCR